VNDRSNCPPDTASIGKANTKARKGQRAPAHRASITILLIFVILYTMFKSFNGFADMATVAIRPLAGCWLFGHWHHSVFPGVLSGVVWSIGCKLEFIMLEYINQLRARRYSIEDAAVEGRSEIAAHYDDDAGGNAGLLPAALSHRLGRTRSVRSPS